MTVGLRTGSIVTEVGSSTFLHAFFSTVSKHLEPEGWGTRYPVLIKELYEGTLPPDRASEALLEVKDIRQRLKTFKPSEVVWDIEDPKARPPWGDKISSTITDLSNYFVTSTGRDFLAALEECIQAAIDNKKPLTIESY